jgi:hypothetical protein
MYEVSTSPWVCQPTSTVGTYKKVQCNPSGTEYTEFIYSDSNCATQTTSNTFTRYTCNFYTNYYETLYCDTISYRTPSISLSNVKGVQELYSDSSCTLSNGFQIIFFYSNCQKTTTASNTITFSQGIISAYTCTDTNCNSCTLSSTNNLYQCYFVRTNVYRKSIPACFGYLGDSTSVQV